jgi:hypothetical protein
MGSWLLGFWWISKALPTQGEHFFFYGHRGRALLSMKTAKKLEVFMVAMTSCRISVWASSVI